MRTQRVVIKGPRRVKLEEAEIADDPLAPHEVLLRTHFSTISPGTELAYYAGGQTLGHRHDPYPFNPGYAAAGEVLDAGADAPVHQGELILAHTPHQSVSRFDSRTTTCVRIPSGVAPDIAPFARLAQVSAVSIRLMQARPGDLAAVTGLGLVGNLAAQQLRVAGMRVLGIDPVSERRRLLERCGVGETLDPARDLAPYESACAVVMECSGQDRGVLTALDLAARHGEVFLIGAAWKRGADVVAADVVRPVFNKFLALRSGWEWQIPLYGERPSGSIAGCTAWILTCLGNGSLQVAELITDRIAPAGAPDAYAGLLDQPAEHLGVVIDWRNS
jgi:2-desacetyl-2-hydroxyethyl bacteriochlorophyllide A dehydrogenase